MFGHLKAEEFINTIEGASLPVARRKHLDTCAICAAQLQSIQTAYNGLAVEETDLPEPDWDDFRSNVRLELLSRAVKRDSTVRRWTGWSVRPAMAWGLSLVLLICVSAGGFLWHVSNDSQRMTTAL